MCFSKVSDRKYTESMTRVLFLRAVALCVSMTSGLVPRISLRTRRGLISGRGVKSARVSAVTSASAVDAATLPPALRSLAAELRSLPDDKYRYKQLLYWAAEYPARQTGPRAPFVPEFLYGPREPRTSLIRSLDRERKNVGTREER